MLFIDLSKSYFTERRTVVCCPGIMEVWKCIEPSFDLGDHHCMPSLRSMAVLVGRAKQQRRARAEKPRGGVLFFSRLCCSFSCTSRANLAASPLVRPTACPAYLLVIERCPRGVRIKSQGCWQGKIGLCLKPEGYSYISWCRPIG